jgi:hypothetical protein
VLDAVGFCVIRHLSTVSRSNTLPVGAGFCRGTGLEVARARGCSVDRDSRAIFAVLGGAVIGGLAGYFFMTDRGRALRRQLEPALEDFARELSGFRGTIQKAVEVANESWNALGDVSGGHAPGNVH